MKYVAIDIESYGLDPFDPNAAIWMISMTTDKLKTKLWEDCNGLKRCPAELESILRDKNICKIIHNAGFDAYYIEVLWGIHIVNIWDTQKCEQVIQAVQIRTSKKKTPSPAEERLKRQHGTALQYVLPRYGLPEPDKSIRSNFVGRRKGIPFTSKEKNYAMDDTRYLLAVQKAQEFILARDEELEVALLENKVVERLVTMRVLGLGIDVKRWLEIADQSLQKYNAIISSLPKQVSNWNSEKQVKAYFKSRGILIESYEELEKTFIKCRDATLAKFISARQLYSNATTYGATWLKDKTTGQSWVKSDGRIHFDVEQILNTGRMSTSNPNVLALPKEGLQRSAIVPRKGYKFVIGDFSGQELGIMAAAAKEDTWIEALLRGDDIHGLTASVISPDVWFSSAIKGCKFPKKCDCPMHKKMREPAKQENFMMPYGGGPDKLLAKIIEAMFKRGIPTKEEVEGLMEPWEAKAFVNKFKRVMRKLNAYLEKNAAEALRTGVSYSADPYRRRRVLNGQADWQIENQGRNNPIQSAGANMLKLSWISLPEEFPVVLPFHDEICCEVPAKLAPKCKKVMKQVMEEAADYITGIKGLIKVEPRIADDFTKR